MNVTVDMKELLICFDSDGFESTLEQRPPPFMFGIEIAGVTIG